MGSWGFLFFGEAEREKRDVLINETAKLYKVNPEIVKKGFDLIENEAKKVHLPNKNQN